MIQPTAQEKEAITRLKGSSTFETVLKWFIRSWEKEIEIALNHELQIERDWASGRCKELKYILDTIDSVDKK